MGIAGFGIAALVGCGVIVLLAVIVAVWVIGIYNSLARGRVGVQGAWADIDVQLKRRHDLIPNLVETVKGYARHEREALEAVIAARARAVSAGPIEDKIAAEGGLTQALGRLMAVAEAYPDLKANTTMMTLMEELTSTENKVAFARQAYNDAVMGYNTQRETFPTNMIAGPFNFGPAELFVIEKPEEKEAPKVSF